MSFVAREILSYEQLIEVLNARVDELKIPLDQLDEIAGLPVNYSSKILRKSKLKKLGTISMPNLFGALGLRLFFLQDDDATARTLARRIPRNDAQVRHRAGDKTSAAA